MADTRRPLVLDAGWEALSTLELLTTVLDRTVLPAC
jgi:hypothetical protein